MIRNYFSILILIGSALGGHLRHHHENHTEEHGPSPNTPPAQSDAPTPIKKLQPVAEAVVEPQYLQAFQNFTVDLLKQSYYKESLTRTGAVGYCPLTLGFLLTLLNERAYDIPAEGIPRILKLSAENVTDAYGSMADSFVEDVLVKGSSHLYTPSQSLQLSPAYKRLYTEKRVLALEGNSEPAAEQINAQIAQVTRQSIVDRLIPKAPVFGPTAAGIFVASFYYKSGWDTAVMSVGQRPFHVSPDLTKNIETLKSAGKFRVLEAPTYDAISLPLLGGRKRVVLVQPRNISLQDYIMTHSQEVFESCPRTWGRRQASVQFPALNLVLATDFHEQLNELAGSKVQCNENGGNANYVQPLVQVVSYKIAPAEFEIAVTNGVQVNQAGRAVAEVKTGSVSASEAEPNSPEQKRSARELVDVQEPEPVEPEEPELAPISLVFDKPFFIYFHDNNLGPISFAAVESFFDSSISTTPIIPESRHHAQDPDDSKDFSEEAKAERWSCSHVHI